MFLTMTAAFAELERNLIAERTQAALLYKEVEAPGLRRRPVWIVPVWRRTQGDRDGV